MNIAFASAHFSNIAATGTVEPTVTGLLATFSNLLKLSLFGLTVTKRMPGFFSLLLYSVVEGT